MIYQNTRLNIVSLMRDIGYAYPDQLIQFFRDAPDAKNVAYYIKKLLDSRNFLWAPISSGIPIIPNPGESNIQYFDTDTHALIYRKSPEIKSDALRSRLRALWILASFTSGEVRHVFLPFYPAQLMFITEDNQCYEITCCNDTTVAQLAMSSRERTLPKGVVDEVNHIVLVQNEDFAAKLKPYGFDSYCILDKNNTPHYGVWE